MHDACGTWIRNGLAATCACAVTMMVLISCATPDPVTGRRPFLLFGNHFTLDEDVALGRRVSEANIEEMKAAGVRINDDPERVAQLREMTERIAAVSDLPGLPYEVTLFHTNIVNAAAAPGGAMMVFEGLYDPEIGLVKDDQELAAVMAHEIAHVNARHVTDRLSILMKAQVATEIAAATAERRREEPWLGDAMRTVFVVGAALWIPSYSRQNEFEADRVGLFYMAKAGYDPRAAPRIWKRVYEEGDQRDRAHLFSTHPASRERYEALNELVPYAMERYAEATGSYPADYTPPPGFPEKDKDFDWRRHRP